MTARLRPRGHARTLWLSVLVLAAACGALASIPSSMRPGDFVEPSPLTALGGPATGQSPLALAGTRSPWWRTGLTEARQRIAQFLAPGSAALLGIITGAGAATGRSALRTWRPLLLTRLTVRAPPVAIG